MSLWVPNVPLLYYGFIPVTAFWTATECAQPGSPGLTPGHVEVYNASSPSQYNTTMIRFMGCPAAACINRS
jgi:hypothetical protein